MDLWAPDEPRYAQVAEEMRAHGTGLGGLLLLRLNGEVYTQKPPLYYWLAAAFGSPGGRVDELAARLPSALAGLGCVLLTFALGRRLLPEADAGFWGAALLLATPRFVQMARRAQLDVLLTLFELLALLLYWLWREQPDRTRRRRLVLAIHSALGLALLTKGPVGLLPLAVMLVHLLWDGRRQEAAALLRPSGWLLSLGPVLGWIAGAVALAPPGFFDAAVVDNLLGRFLHGTAHIRPFYYYLYQLPLDFLPWSGLLPAAVVAAWPALRRSGSGLRDGTPVSGWRLLWVWAGVFLVFFSLSSGKRGLYLLPAFPCLALLCAGAVHSLPTTSTWRRIGLGLAGLPLVVASVTGLLLAAMPEPTLVLDPGFALPASLGIPLLLAALGTPAVLLALSRTPLAASPLLRTRGALPGLVGAFVALEIVFLLLLLPRFDPEKSPRPVAEAVARTLPPSESVGLYDFEAFAGGLAYYSGRRVIPLESPAALREFLDGGGRAVVSKAHRLATIASMGPWRIEAESRHGRRRLLLLVPAASESTPPP